MKVVHIIKKIEEVDQDIRELKKLEKSVKKNKSFTTPIYMSIEKQINIILGERIKLLELRIENPPEALRKEIEGAEGDEMTASLKESAPEIEKKRKEARPKKAAENDMPEDEIRMLTQDQIDAKINIIEAEKRRNRPSDSARAGSEQKISDDSSVKILDIALEKGTLVDKDEKQERDKKVKFFRDNFPVE
ncbi:MAG: hypothetical protein A2W19_16505 [Spirochaetes bacterium RBG_16_49_21]|nr:MAG: hypothetical protein A2W19_16505 [Spirochaetes bacterium RBG_16_49_21]